MTFNTAPHVTVKKLPKHFDFRFAITNLKTGYGKKAYSAKVAQDIAYQIA